MVSIEVGVAITQAASPRVRRWRHIRAAAIELFSARGFADVSVDEIAAAAEVSRRTYFNYFATKSAVLFDPDPDESHRLAVLLREGDPDNGAWTSLTKALLSYLRGQEPVVTARREILGADPSLDPMHMLANAQFQQSILQWLIERGMDEVRAALVSGIALAVVRETFRRWRPAEAEYGVFLDALAEGFAFAAEGMSTADGHTLTPSP